MKENAKSPTLPISSAQPARVVQPLVTEKAQAGSPSANDLGQGVDRPGFDLGGSTGDTHAGSGLGLGEDAFETPGDRRLPGRRPDNDLTIPRWSGPDPHDVTVSDKKTADTETPPAPETEKQR